jgi:hypothetical protein
MTHVFRFFVVLFAFVGITSTAARADFTYLQQPSSNEDIIGSVAQGENFSAQHVDKICNSGYTTQDVINDRTRTGSFGFSFLVTVAISLNSTTSAHLVMNNGQICKAADDLSLPYGSGRLVRRFMEVGSISLVKDTTASASVGIKCAGATPESVPTKIAGFAGVVQAICQVAPSLANSATTNVNVAGSNLVVAVEYVNSNHQNVHEYSRHMADFKGGTATFGPGDEYVVTFSQPLLDTSGNNCTTATVRYTPILTVTPAQQKLCMFAGPRAGYYTQVNLLALPGVGFAIQNQAVRTQLNVTNLEAKPLNGGRFDVHANMNIVERSYPLTF